MKPAENRDRDERQRKRTYKNPLGDACSRLCANINLPEYMK